MKKGNTNLKIYLTTTYISKVNFKFFLYSTVFIFPAKAEEEKQKAYTWTAVEMIKNYRPNITFPTCQDPHVTFLSKLLITVCCLNFRTIFCETGVYFIEI